MTRRIFEIEVDVPSTVGAARLRHYIRDAVGGWGGEFHADDPLFDFRRRIIGVRAKPMAPAAPPRSDRKPVPRGR